MVHPEEGRVELEKIIPEELIPQSYTCLFTPFLLKEYILP